MQSTAINLYQSYDSTNYLYILFHVHTTIIIKLLNNYILMTINNFYTISFIFVAIVDAISCCSDNG